MKLLWKSALISAAFCCVLFAVGCGGVSQGQTNNPVLPTIAFTTSADAIKSGEFVTLSWDVTNATSVTMSPNVNGTDDGTALPLKGSRALVLQQTTTYVLTAVGPNGTATKSLTITVTAAAPTATLQADPATMMLGSGSTLRWTTTAATDVSIDNGIGPVSPTAGTTTVTPAGTTTYTLTAKGAGGAATATATVTVTPPAELALTLSASKSTITQGERVTLTWTSQNASAVSISPAPGAVAVSGSADVQPATTTTYTATATSLSGITKTASVTVMVLSPSAGLSNIKHIILFVQENRSFDNYFGPLGEYKQSKGFANDIDGLDVTTQLKTYSGKTVTPFHQRTVDTDVMSPSWNESHFYLDRQPSGEFKMDNWMMQQQCSILVAADPECTRTMGYYDQRDIPYYYELATQFATSDRFHSAVLSGTLVNRAFLFSATSGGMNNPGDPFPADAPTIFRRLSEAGISWKYYYQDDSIFLGSYQCGGGCDWDKYMSNVEPIDNYYQILSRPTADHDLPQVVFIEHAAKLRLDEHTGSNLQLGVALSQKIIDALMQSKAWPSSVFFLTYDEGGGMYDHVPPYQVSNPDGKAPLFEAGDIGQWDNFTYSGYRVPLLVISPWVRPHFVSHVNREFGSILKFIEVRFGLLPLTKRDAESDDMLEFFDFTAPSWLVPPTLPTQPTDGIVDRSLEKFPG